MTTALHSFILLLFFAYLPLAIPIVASADHQWKALEISPYPGEKPLHLVWKKECEGGLVCTLVLRKNSPTGDILYDGETIGDDYGSPEAVWLGRFRAVKFVSSEPNHNIEETLLFFTKNGSARAFHQYQGRSSSASEPVEVDSRTFRIDCSYGSGLLSGAQGLGPQIYFGFFVTFRDEYIQIEEILDPRRSPDDPGEDRSIKKVRNDKKWSELYCKEQLDELNKYPPDDLSEDEAASIAELRRFFDKLCQR